MQRFSGNIFATRCLSHMGFSPLILESKLWHLIFLNLMIFLVTLTFDSILLLKMWAFLDQFAYIFTTIITKWSILIKLEAWMFCIGYHGHVPDEYQPDENKKNWFYANLRIPITISPAKLWISKFSNFGDICRKPLHIISKLTVVS